MKAIRCHELGPPSSLIYEEVESPKISDDDVLIDVHACSVNFPDTLIIKGQYQFKPNLPFSPGSDVSGTVVSIGDKVKNFSLGDEVIGIMLNGGYAEQAAINQHMLIPKPNSMSFEEASCFLYTYSTSYYALKYRAQIKAGDKVLVLGASGGVGLAAVQLAKALGAFVIAAASTDEKLQVCKDHGADELINYTNEDLKAKVKTLTQYNGIDIVLDPVGGEYAEPAVRTLAWNGRYLVVGFTGGYIPRIPLNLCLLKSCQIVGVFLGAFAMKFPKEMHQLRLELLELYKTAGLKPYISKTYALEQAPQAIQDMMDRKAIGKLVVKIK